MNHRWPLAVSPFTLWNKIRIASWLLSSDRYTMGERVEEFERKMSKFSNSYALMTSSGSSANQLVFELWKANNPCENAVVHVPACTWISSISPAVSAGFEIKFCDVNLHDFSFDYEMLVKNLKESNGRRQIIWPTALIGFTPNMWVLKELAKKYNAELYMDSCENMFAPNILSSCDITTTSMYMSHHTVSLEAGFCFFQNEHDYKVGKMLRNHGLTRSLPPLDPLRKRIEAENPKVDPQFLFALMGTNLRPTDVHAAFGLEDFKRIDKNKAHRNAIWEAFSQGLGFDKYYLPVRSPEEAAFCLPIFRLDGDMTKVKTKLKELDIESRPIIGGNLLRQPAFRGYALPESFPNAEWIHTHGCYVGLHGDVTEDMVNELIDELNSL